MPPSPKAGTNPTFVCSCSKEARSACRGEPFYREHEGNPYCVLHFPGGEKSADFKEALKRKLDAKNFNFRGVRFPDRMSFGSFQFGGKADFTFAHFDAADFTSAVFGSEAVFQYCKFTGEASFRRATFGAQANFVNSKFVKRAIFRDVKFEAGVSFTLAQFGAGATFSHTSFASTAVFSFTSFAEADFLGAKFAEEAFFGNATFRGMAMFSYATFSAKANFVDATFAGGADFSHAAFGSYVRFAGTEKEPLFGEQSSLSLQFAIVEKPEHVSFHTLKLRPNWFVNVDARKFEFTNVEWDWRAVEQEVNDLKRKVTSPHRLLAIACRHLADNAEESHRYEEASRFRYMAMDARRLESWRGFAPWRLSWWYWLASGYGERVLRALVLLLVVWLLFAALYTRVGFARWEPRRTNEREAMTEPRDEAGEPLRLPRAMTYSLGVMTLQKPEPRPATTAAQTFVILETILGPLQAALLALAIRRKFMR